MLYSSASKVLILCLHIYFVSICAGQQYAILSVNSTENNNEIQESCAIYNSSATELPNAPTNAGYPILLVNNQTQCLNMDTPDSLAGFAMMAFLNENCSMNELAMFGQRLNASLIVFVVPESRLSAARNNVSVSKSITVPVLVVDNMTGAEIQMDLENVSAVYLQGYAPSRTLNYPSIVILIIIAVTTVCLGSFLANMPYEFLWQGLLYPDGGFWKEYEAEIQKPKKKFGDLTPKEKMTYIFIIAITVIVMLAVMALFVLLYFFFSVVVYIFIALFALLSVFTLYSTLSPFVASIPYINDKLRLPPNKIPILRNRPGPLFFLTYLFSIGIVIWWGFERNSLYGWALHAILGFSYCTFFFKVVKFTTRPWLLVMFMIISVFTDIFLVYVTRRLSNDNVSALERYALGPAGSTERIPILFSVINFLYPTDLDTVCNIPRSASFLGFGDVVIPGMLVVLCLRHDLTARAGNCFKQYFFTVSIGYIVGLIFVFVVAGVTGLAQPALLILVPTILVGVVILSLINREFRQFFFPPLKAKSADVEKPNEEVTGDQQVQLGLAEKGELQDTVYYPAPEVKN